MDKLPDKLKQPLVELLLSVADDKFMLGINFYVKGVKGKPPAGK